VLCSLEKEGGTAVLCGKILQSQAFSGFMVLSKKLGFLEKKKQVES
jgi:hypothetical protein